MRGWYDGAVRAAYEDEDIRYWYHLKSNSGYNLPRLDCVLQTPEDKFWYTLCTRSGELLNALYYKKMQCKVPGVVPKKPEELQYAQGPYPKVVPLYYYHSTHSVRLTHSVQDVRPVRLTQFSTN